MTFFALFGVALAFRFLLDSFAREKLRKSGITDIDKMDGHQFEHYLALLFQSQGYKAKVTRAAGDYGADLILEKGNSKIVVQAKRYGKNVGVSAVQQVVGSRAHYGASDAWVITNRDFTEAAQNLAKSNQVRLINRGELIDMILKLNPAAVPNPKKVLSKTLSKK
ncbi:restriction endonuclease [Brevibacillus humidisoli]|uniref:restriction endonuclease n=1 Tax=Brevibacillus humidisoli TaxID=2895522 RepID=UPI001E3539D4|nr:restriction endonuclease [Brevibacillus humidisoli]UFJ43060.1 restriction endonuclease [Brevibacillus humidisoli]